MIWLLLRIVISIKFDWSRMPWLHVSGTWEKGGYGGGDEGANTPDLLDKEPYFNRWRGRLCTPNYNYHRIFKSSYGPLLCAILD